MLLLWVGGFPAEEIRDLKTFLPRPGQEAAAPQGQVVQLLLDRQELEGGHESYLVQVLFRGKPAVHRVHRVRKDRVEIDFLDTGKPPMRLARVRGGVVEASSVEELYYRKDGKLKRLVRITLFTHARPEIRFRDTLDRTLILFRIERDSGQGKSAPAGTPVPLKPAPRLPGKASPAESR